VLNLHSQDITRRSLTKRKLTDHSRVRKRSIVHTSVVHSIASRGNVTNKSENDIVSRDNDQIIELHRDDYD
jgi:hypothetical protein